MPNNEFKKDLKISILMQQECEKEIRSDIDEKLSANMLRKVNEHNIL